MEKIYHGIIPPKAPQGMSSVLGSDASVKWPNRFLLLAEHIATWSKDPSTQVGAVIADSKRRIISIGYNGFPRGVIDGQKRLRDRQLKYRFIVHAEANALLTAPGSVEGCGLYCTHLPCSACAGMIIQRGIKAVYVPQKMVGDLEERWKEDWDVTREMFKEANVALWQI